MITKEKMPWCFITFSQLILKGNVWRSVWRICMWILGLKGLKLRGWQKDKQNFVSFSLSWSILAFLTIGSFFKNNCRNSDMLYWSRAFELILYLAGLTSWCLRIKFPPSLFMNTMNLVDYLNLSLSLHNTHNHCHPFMKKVKKQLFFTIQSLWHSDSHSNYKSVQSWKGAHHSKLEQTTAHSKINNLKNKSYTKFLL